MVNAKFATLPAHQKKTTWQLGSVPNVPIIKTLLRDGIEQKIKKRYAKPTIGDFWLIVYSALITTIRIRYLAEATKLLDTDHHPFDQVWLFSPFPGLKNGDALRVWPK